MASRTPRNGRSPFTGGLHSNSNQTGNSDVRSGSVPGNAPDDGTTPPNSNPPPPPQNSGDQFDIRILLGGIGGVAGLGAAVWLGFGVGVAALVAASIGIGMFGLGSIGQGTPKAVANGDNPEKTKYGDALFLFDAKSPYGLTDVSMEKAAFLVSPGWLGASAGNRTANGHPIGMSLNGIGHVIDVPMIGEVDLTGWISREGGVLGVWPVVRVETIIDVSGVTPRDIKVGLTFTDDQIPDMVISVSPYVAGFKNWDKQQPLAKVLTIETAQKLVMSREGGITWPYIEQVVANAVRRSVKDGEKAEEFFAARKDRQAEIEQAVNDALISDGICVDITIGSAASYARAQASEQAQVEGKVAAAKAQGQLAGVKELLSDKEAMAGLGNVLSGLKGVLGGMGTQVHVHTSDKPGDKKKSDS